MLVWRWIKQESILLTIGHSHLFKTSRSFCQNMLVAWSLNVPHSTFIDRYDDIYELSIEYKPGVGKSGSQTGKLKDSVTKYFDEKGNLREDLFHPRIKQLIKSVRSKKSN